MNEQQVNSLAFDPGQPSEMYLALEDDGLWKSDDRGKTLAPLNSGFVARRLTAVTVSGKRLVAIQTQDGNSTGTFVSEDSGTTWTKVQRIQGLSGVHLTSLPACRVTTGCCLPPIPAKFLNLPIAGFLEVLDDCRSTGGHSHGTHPVHSTARGRRWRARGPVSHTYRPIAISKPDGHYQRHPGGTSGGHLTAACCEAAIRALPGSSRGLGYADNFDAIYKSPISDGRLVARSAVGIYFSNDFGRRWSRIPFRFPPAQLTDFAVPPVGTYLTHARRD